LMMAKFRIWRQQSPRHRSRVCLSSRYNERVFLQPSSRDACTCVRGPFQVKSAEFEPNVAALQRRYCLAAFQSEKE
jgi:hypothetical protein